MLIVRNMYMYESTESIPHKEYSVFEQSDYPQPSDNKYLSTS